MSSLATDLATQIDHGPLAWVQAEIDNALTRGLAALADFAAAPGEVTSLKHAQTHIHQAAGAIQMVGLDAVVAFTDEMERLLRRLQETDAANAPEACEAIDRAGRRLKIFLNELVNGAPLIALRLFPEYEAMQRVRGVQAPTPADLFFPDLSMRPSLPAIDDSGLAQKLPSLLVQQRRVFQRGLLSFLHGDESGAKTMREAIGAIESVTASPAGRAFWWTVGAVLDAVEAKGIEGSLGLKQLVARIDVQIRRLVEGSSKVADRLRREVLYYAAISAPVTPSVQEVQRVFRLADLIPSAEAMSADLLRIEPLLRQAREQIGLAKDAWLKFTAGRADNLPRLKQTMTLLRQRADEIGNPALTKLIAGLIARLDNVPLLNLPEGIALEYATGLLFAENALENYASLGLDFPQQVGAMLARLDTALSGRPAAAVGAMPLIDEMARRAQERMLLASVCREIQTNLRRMEQVLDGFFRDQTRRGELATLDNDSRQIRGALRMLGFDQAEQLLAHCQRQIDSYATSHGVVSTDDLELLAESLSCLGFYIEAVEQQRPAPEKLITPLLARRSEDRVGIPIEELVGSAESAVRELRQTLPRLVAEVRHAPSDERVRSALRRKLAALRDDATLIGDGPLVEQANAALQELDTGATVELAATVSAISETAAGAPAPDISEETQRLLSTDEKELDAEFLHIYLAEAGEVLDSIGENRAVLEKDPAARSALRTVRRGFHTLKGSGRMVGLNDLGEIAYGVERIHNRLLEEDHPVTLAVLAMIGTAEASFRYWLKLLQENGFIQPDASELRAQIHAVESELAGREPVTLEMPEEWLSAPGSMPEVTVAETLSIEPQPAGQEFSFDWPEAPAFPATTPSLESESIASAEAPAPAALSAVRPLDLDAALAPRDVSTVPPESVSPALPAITALKPEPVEAMSGDAPAPEPVEEALADIVDLPELGATGGSVPQIAAMEEAFASDAIVQTTATYAVAGARLDAMIEAPIAEPPPLEKDEITLGEVTLPRSLFDILVEEASGRVGTLAAELEAMQFDASLMPSETMVRAAHTLCGIHRTSGFALVAQTARCLEQCLLALQRPGEPRPVTALPVLARANSGLERLVGRMKSREAFTGEDRTEAVEIQYALEALRQETTLDSTVADSDSLAAREAARDQEQVRREAAAASTPIAAIEAPSAASTGEASVGKIDQPAGVPPTSIEQPMASTTAERPAPALQVDVEPEAEAPLDVGDDVDDQVLPIFLEEATELFPQAGEALRAWRRQPADADAAHRLRRTLHTFKGSARMAGAMRLGELTHRMESRVLDAEALAHPTPPFFDSLDTNLDRIAFVLEALRAGKTNVPLPGLAGKAALGMPAAEIPFTVPRPPHLVHEGSKAEVLGQPVPVQPLAAPAQSQPPEFEPGQRALLRVRADIIDRLVNEAGEMAITRARVDSELRSLKQNLLELTSSVIRLRSQVREIEIQGETQIQSRMSITSDFGEGFDPLEFDRYTRFQELTRSLTESVNDVATVQQSLLKNIDDADVALLSQARLSREMQQQLFAIRTVPFGSLSERLYRIVRQTAKELDKRVNLEIHGGQVELDRSVLEKLVGPLEHLLRNALDHGIELRDARLAAGKSEIGEIMLTVRQVGNEIVIEIADDGGGLDLPQIRAKGTAQQRFAADTVPTYAQLIDCIFQPGFSTAQHVTALSGRGIGMDVVRAEVAALGGRIDVSTQQGRGTTFQLYLPLTLAVAQAVLVRAAGRLWALPAPMVEQVQQVKPDELRALYEQGAVEWQDKRYPFHYLPRLLGDTQRNPETSRHNPILLLRSGQNLAAVHVDETIGNQEVVVKNIGPQLARVSGIAGATVLGTGEIVLIINPVQLAQRSGVTAFDPNAPDQVVASLSSGSLRAPVSLAPLVMVVDDSLTVRKVMGRMLAREGFGVLTARDGIDALQLLAEHKPDVILLDIEMPRMDGFELTKMLKGTPKHAHIPIIMITSRTAEKHRNRAKELGVDLYLGKPFQEDELLSNLREMLALTP